MRRRSSFRRLKRQTAFVALLSSACSLPAAPVSPIIGSVGTPAGTSDILEEEPQHPDTSAQPPTTTAYNETPITLINGERVDEAAPIDPPEAAPAWEFAYFHSRYETTTFVPNLAALCHAAKAELGVNARCWTEKAPTFQPDATFLSIHVLRVASPDANYRSLVVQTPDGFAQLPISWNVETPGDPGCPSIIRDIAIERVFAVHGHLAVATLGIRQGYVDAINPADDGLRDELVRRISIVTPEAGRVWTKTSEGMVSPSLGTKLQDRPSNDTPWHLLPWTTNPAFHVTPDGDVAVGAAG